MTDNTIRASEATVSAFAGSSIALVGLWFVFAWPWISGDMTIPWDGKAHFAPQVQFLAASIARGEWPWWAPDVFAGHPQIADPQSMIFSPPMVLLALLNPAPSLWAIDLAVLLTVLFGGLGVLSYGRLVGWHWAAAMIAALVFMFGAAMAWRIQHFGQVMSLAYVPFALVSLRVAVRDGSYLGGVGAGLLGATVLLGRDQVGLLAVYTLAAYALFLLASGRGAHVVRLTAFAPLVAGAVVGLIVVALPLWMTMLLAEQSNRPDIDFAGAAAGSLHPALLLTAFAANLYGSAGDMADFWGPPSFAWNDTGLFLAQNMGISYVSVLAILTLTYGVVSGAALKHEARFWSVALILVLAYALGGYTPLFGSIYELVPGVDKFRRPADALFLVGAFAAFVIGRVLSEAIVFLQLPQSAKSPIIRRAAIAIALFILGLIAVLGVGAWRGELAASVTAVLASAVWASLAAAAFGLMYWLTPIRPVVGAMALIAVTAADLRVNNGPNGATALPTAAIDMLQPAEPHRTVAEIKARLRAASTGWRRNRTEFVGLGYHWPNAPMAHGLPVTLGANPVRLRWYAKATGAIDTIANVDQRQFPSAMPDYAGPLARRLGLQWVVLPDGAARIGKLGEISTGQTRVGGHTIYELPTPMPRVVFATGVKTIDQDALISAALPGDYGDRRLVYLPPGHKAQAVIPATAEVRIDRYENTRVRLTVVSDQPGWVVFHDTWHPWWTATVDGKPSKILRANGIFRAVRVGAGENRIEMTFKPLQSAIAEARRRIGLASAGEARE